MKLTPANVARWCCVLETHACLYLAGDRNLPSDVLERIEYGLATIEKIKQSKPWHPGWLS